MVIKGILYYGDKPQVRLDIDTFKERYEHEDLNNTPVLPFEFSVRGINKESFQLFLNDRVMPSTRQGMRALLEWADIPFYDVALIARRNYFSSCNDHFWIQPEGESVTWDQVQKL